MYSHNSHCKYVDAQFDISSVFAFIEAIHAVKEESGAHWFVFCKVR